MINRLTKEEMETLISYDPIDDIWNAYTTIPKDMRRFQKKGWQFVRSELFDNGKVMSMTFTAPGNTQTIGKANKVKRYYSEEQRKKMAERLIATKTR